MGIRWIEKGEKVEEEMEISVNKFDGVVEEFEVWTRYHTEKYAKLWASRLETLGCGPYRVILLNPQTYEGQAVSGKWGRVSRAGDYIRQSSVGRKMVKDG